MVKNKLVAILAMGSTPEGAPMKVTAAATIAIVLSLGSTLALAEGLVGSIVSSPLSADGYVTGSRTGLNIYLQTEDAPGLEFMNPQVLGYGIPAGGRMEVEMVTGFERDQTIPLGQPSIMVVTGAPQQGLPGKAAGYTVTEGSNQNTFVIAPAPGKALIAEKLMTPAPGAKGDPIRQRGIKVIHVGLKKAFINRGNRGVVAVRILDRDGKIVRQDTAAIDFIDTPQPQIFPNNFANKRRNHNWQTIASGAVVGQAPGTVPIALLLFGNNAPGGKKGSVGTGVISTQQLEKMKYRLPDELSRYTGGLMVQDSNGDGIADPKVDRIIGGVIGAAPAGARGQELRSVVRDGVATLSRPTTAFAKKPGKAFGGAIMLLEFVAGDKPGLYRPTLALLKDPGNLAGGDGSQYTYTIVVR